MDIDKKAPVRIFPKRKSQLWRKVETTESAVIHAKGNKEGIGELVIIDEYDPEFEAERLKSIIELIKTCQP